MLNRVSAVPTFPVPEIEITLSQLSWLMAMTLSFIGVWWLTLYLDR